MSSLRFATLLLAGFVTSSASALEMGAPVESPLPRPAALMPAIAFWTRVYTEIDSASGFVHDKRHLDLIYQTLYLNPDAPPAAQNKAIETALEDYRQALLTLASGKRRNLSRVEQRALLTWGEYASRADLEAAAQRLRFQRGQSDRFQTGLTRSARWKTRIQAIFRAKGLPPELAALPHIESSYHPRARSKVGAMGLWQFMPATARRYLRVDEVEDERLDPYKSSEAAAQFLQHNHSVLKSWPLAITAYNHGLSGVRRAVRETGTEDIGEIAKTYEGERFGFASRNFYAAFLAAVDVSANPERYFGTPQRQEVQPIEVVAPAYLPVDALIDAFRIDKDQLRALNPSLHHAIWNGEHFVPKGRALNLPANRTPEQTEEILREVAQQFGFSSQKPYRQYEVRLGDSLSHIAQAHNATVPQLMAMNHLAGAHEIYAGQVLRVPMGPLPQPLGTGSASMLAAQLDSGDIEGVSTRTTDVPVVIAMVAEPESIQNSGMGTASVQAGNPAELPGGLCQASISTESFVDVGGLDGTEPASQVSPAEAQPELAADPVDYGVGADGTIEIQTTETLGHYAEWLGLHSDRLKEVNQLPDDQPLIVGHRLRLDFSKATADRFEQQRIAHHKSRQLRYFRRYRISGVREHPVATGDNLWLLAVQQYGIPIWLVRQYNPDIDVDTILPLGSVIFVPMIEALPTSPLCPPADKQQNLAGMGDASALATAGSVEP